MYANLIKIAILIPGFIWARPSFPDGDRTAETDTLTIVAVGDIMLGSDYPSASTLPPGSDCHSLLSGTGEILRSGDITFGNLEGTFAGPFGHAKQGKHCYAFRMPESFASCLAEAGFDILNLANNHALDFGPAGYRNTVRVLDSLGIIGFGHANKTPLIFQKNGLAIGFCAFAYNSNGPDIKNIQEAVRIVRSLGQETNMIIVSFHGGAEGEAHQRVPRATEYFLGENRGDVYRFAHAVVNAGADVVLGHGPHVPRALELYQGRLIAYSLGNFCTYGQFNLDGPCGNAPILRIQVNSTGEFLSSQIIPIFQKPPGIPQIDEKKRCIETLKRLTQADFPETSLEISNEGIITIRR
jgi:hypothetical protein